MLNVWDQIRLEDSQEPLLRALRPLSSLTASYSLAEETRRKWSISLICLIVILQNVVDFSVSANMVWMASLAGNSTFRWLPCKMEQPTNGGQASPVVGTAATLVYYLLVAVFSVVGGYLGDTKLGRFKTLKLALLLMVVGTACYAALAVVLGLNDKENNFEVRRAVGTIFYHFMVYVLLAFSITICAAGSGIHSANIVPFALEQCFNSPSDDMNERGKYISLSKVFHLLYFMRNTGCLITFSAVSSLQEHHLLFGCCVPLICALISAGPLLMGERYFVANVPRVNMSSVFVNVIKEGYRLSKVPGTVPDSGELHFLDYSKVEYGGSFSRDDVKAVKRLISLIPMLSIYMVYYVLYSQMHTTFYMQGLFIKTPPYFPYSGGSAINSLTVLLLIPFVVFVIYPYLTAKHGPISPFVKTQVGFALIALAMVAAGILEYFRVLHTQPAYHETVEVRLHFASLMDMTILQSLHFYYRFPQYILIGISEVMVVIVALKTAYIEAPREYKSAVFGIYYMFNALGTFIAMIILLATQAISYFIFEGDGWVCTDFNVGRIYYFFYILCGIMIVNMMALARTTHKFENKINY